MEFTKIFKRKLFFFNFLSIFINAFFQIRWCLSQKIRKFTLLLFGTILDFGYWAKSNKSLLINLTQNIGVDYESDAHFHIKEDIDIYIEGKKRPFESEKSDNIFSLEVFEHVFNYNQIIPKINSVLKRKIKFYLHCLLGWKNMKFLLINLDLQYR
ncbi:MAG: hypothetical protein ACOYMA_18680 [Bacteroidia bacterium]